MCQILEVVNVPVPAYKVNSFHFDQFELIRIFSSVEHAQCYWRPARPSGGKGATFWKQVSMSKPFKLSGIDLTKYWTAGSGASEKVFTQRLRFSTTGRGNPPHLFTSLSVKRSLIPQLPQLWKQPLQILHRGPHCRPSEQDHKEGRGGYPESESLIKWNHLFWRWKYQRKCNALNEMKSRWRRTTIR